MNRNQFALLLVVTAFFALIGGAISVWIFGGAVLARGAAPASGNRVVQGSELRLVDASGKTLARWAPEHIMVNGASAVKPYLEFYKNGKSTGGISMELDGGLYTLRQNPENKLQLMVTEDRGPHGEVPSSEEP